MHACPLGVGIFSTVRRFERPGLTLAVPLLTGSVSDPVALAASAICAAVPCALAITMNLGQAIREKWMYVNDVCTQIRLRHAGPAPVVKAVDSIGSSCSDNNAMKWIKPQFVPKQQLSTSRPCSTMPPATTASSWPGQPAAWSLLEPSMESRQSMLVGESARSIENNLKQLCHRCCYPIGALGAAHPTRGSRPAGWIHASGELRGTTSTDYLGTTSSLFESLGR